MSRLKHKIDVLSDVLHYDAALLKNFGPNIALRHFIMKVVFRGTNTNMGRKLYRSMYSCCEKRLYKDFSYVIDKYRDITVNKDHLISKESPVWIFWWQGVESAPDVVQFCINSVRMNAGEHPIIIITKDNFKQYTDIPDHVLEKVEKGVITLTHFSDHLRVELLSKNGGIWIDATVWIRQPISDEICNYSLYTIKHGKYSDYHVCKGLWSCFFLCASKGNPLMNLCKEFLSEYWKKYDLLICYLLIDIPFAIAYDNLPWAREMIDSIPGNNTLVFELQEHMNDVFLEDKMLEWDKGTIAHKMSYKIPFDEYKGKEITNWGYLMNEIKKLKSENRLNR